MPRERNRCDSPRTVRDVRATGREATGSAIHCKAGPVAGVRVNFSALPDFVAIGGLVAVFWTLLRRTRQSRLNFWLVGWVLLLLIMLTIWLAMRSPWGRVLKGIREDEEAVRSLGKNVYSYKMQALMFGGVIGALAGFLIALDRANAQPDTYSTDFTFYLYAIMILGGAARVFGPLVGAAIFWFLVNFMSRTLQDLAQTGILPSAVLDTTQAGPLVFVMVGLGIVLMLIFRPQGIFGDKREITLDVR